ncbi:MAG: helix-turn-helix domain-containing protein [Blastocatellia bacterium]
MRPPCRTWLKRFNKKGLDGLQDRGRCGRPATYNAAQVAEVIAVALSDPQKLGQPFACWTLDRLEIYLNEEKQIAIKRSRIDELLIAEGFAGARRRLGSGNALIQSSRAKKPKRSTPLPLPTAP